MSRARSGRQRLAVVGDSECGSASLWVLACCVLLLSVGLIIMIRSLGVLARHRAESAADLAAVAGAEQIGVEDDAICLAARRVAQANHATLSVCSTALDADGRSGAVRVRVEVHANLPGLGPQTVPASARAGRLAANP